MPIFPTSVEIQHLQWVKDGSTDADGNPTGAFSDPVVRLIIGIQQLGDGRVDPISVEYVERTITDLLLQVPDTTPYKKLDRVLVNNGVEWLAYEVQNRPVSWSNGLPWQRYSQIFGGTVHVRRVD
jgi:hypothetical protein